MGLHEVPEGYLYGLYTKDFGALGRETEGAADFPEIENPSGW
jgi:hypothetical protein